MTNIKYDVAIIDYGMGNLFSVKRACEHVGLNAVITHASDKIMNSSGVILPGVGAFGDAMSNLIKYDLVSPIKDYIQTGKPFMGICLGMQLMLSESEEFGAHKGLDIISGKVVKFPRLNAVGNTVKVPQVGWNSILLASVSWKNTPLEETADGEAMYFVHSFYCIPDKAENYLTATVYEDTKYCSSLIRGNVFAAQYHPEKSAKEGIKIYQNWGNSVKKGSI